MLWLQPQYSHLSNLGLWVEPHNIQAVVDMSLWPFSFTQTCVICVLIQSSKCTVYAIGYIVDVCASLILCI